jgi:hypothetical protein
MMDPMTTYDHFCDDADCLTCFPGLEPVESADPDERTEREREWLIASTLENCTYSARALEQHRRFCERERRSEPCDIGALLARCVKSAELKHRLLFAETVQTDLL